MKVYYRKKYVYIDASVLCGYEASDFLRNLAQDTLAVYLYVRDNEEREEVQERPWYIYVCDTVCGDSMMKTVLSASALHNQEHSAICIIGTGEMFTEEPSMDVCYLGMPNVERLEDIRIKRTCEHGFRWMLVNFLMFGSLFYFIVFMTFIDDMPYEVSEGVVGMASILLPPIVMVITLIYALVKRVYRWDTVWDNIWHVLFEWF